MLNIAGGLLQRAGDLPDLGRVRPGGRGRRRQGGHRHPVAAADGGADRDEAGRALALVDGVSLLAGHGEFLEQGRAAGDGRRGERLPEVFIGVKRQQRAVGHAGEHRLAARGDVRGEGHPDARADAHGADGLDRVDEPRLGAVEDLQAGRLAGLRGHVLQAAAECRTSSCASAPMPTSTRTGPARYARLPGSWMAKPRYTSMPSTRWAVERATPSSSAASATRIRGWTLSMSSSRSA